jgi:hypothetical protein
MDPTTSGGSRTGDTQQAELAFRDELGKRRNGEEQPGVSPEPNISFPAEAVLAAKPPQAAEIPLWAQRLQLIIFVVFCIQLGLLLAVLPWKPVWTDNSLVAGMPGLRAVLQHNFVRGLVTGLGLVDIWLGVMEAVRYREKK